MNLLGMLLKVMTAKSAVKQIARKTGLSEKQVKRLMTIAKDVSAAVSCPLNSV